VSHSTERRRRRFVALATTLAICLGSLAIPAAALADGEIDPSFAAIGYHFGADGAGISLDPVVDRVPTVRVPTVVQSDGKIVIGGRGADDFMTLVRYNSDGTLDTSFGSDGTGFVRRQFPVTPGTVAKPPALGPSGAVAMTQDASGNLYVAGIGGGASQFVAEYSADGAYMTSSVCYAPTNIAYTPRAIALRPDGSIVIAGAARDRRLDASGTAARTMYGQRAIVNLPASDTTTTGCGTRTAGLGSDGVSIDGLGRDGSVLDATLSGRWYDGVVALPDNRYVVVSTNGPVGAGTAAWVQRYSAAGALDATFNSGRVSIAGAGLHAAALLGDGSVLASGELNGQMLLARITTGGSVTSSTMTAGLGNDTGQAMAVQPDGKVIVGGGATVGSRLAVALVRFTADGATDTTFGTGGQTTTLIGTHDAYFTGLALSGTTVAASGRARTTAAPGTLFSIAARYFANGTPAVPVVTPPNGPVGPVVTRVVGTTTVVTAPAVVKTVKQAVKRSCIVPKVKGKLLKKARKALVTRGCRVKVTYAPSTKKAVNIVLAQSRKAGKKLAFRSIVKLMVAKKAHVKVAKKA
jgi:uncharacterized delta-60 repeat protein